MRTRTILTLRAARYPEEPKPGALMASETGKSVYQILAVTKVRRAGEAEYRFRLTCGMLRGNAVPPGGKVHPFKWRSTGYKTPEPICTPLESEDGKPLVIGPRRPPRPRRQDEPQGAVDFGPSLRLRALRDRHGRLLREADVEIDGNAVDPRYPLRRVRRAYRVDSLDLLRRNRTIGKRELDAAADLRKHLERIGPPMAARFDRMGVAHFLCQPIVDEHIKSAKKLRQVADALGDHWSPVLWVCLGGSVRGYAMQFRQDDHVASQRVIEGLGKLADFFYGKGR